MLSEETNENEMILAWPFFSALLHDACELKVQVEIKGYMASNSTLMI